jgi:hypothetical protein
MGVRKNDTRCRLPLSIHIDLNRNERRTQTRLFDVAVLVLKALSQAIWRRSLVAVSTSQLAESRWVRWNDTRCRLPLSIHIDLNRNERRTQTRLFDLRLLEATRTLPETLYSGLPVARSVAVLVLKALSQAIWRRSLVAVSTSQLAESRWVNRQTRMAGSKRKKSSPNTTLPSTLATGKANSPRKCMRALIHQPKLLCLPRWHSTVDPAFVVLKRICPVSARLGAKLLVPCILIQIFESDQTRLVLCSGGRLLCQRTDGADPLQYNKRRIYCPRKECGSLILNAGSGDMVIEDREVRFTR